MSTPANFNGQRPVHESAGSAELPTSRKPSRAWVPQAVSTTVANTLMYVNISMRPLPINWKQFVALQQVYQRFAYGYSLPHRPIVILELIS
jgi:hypothetical protein